jgi:hypothetical protein
MKYGEVYMIKYDILKHLICYEVKVHVLKNPFLAFILVFKRILDKIVENSHLQEFVAQTMFFLCIALPTLQTFNMDELWTKFDLARVFLGQGGHIYFKIISSPIRSCKWDFFFSMETF